MKKLLFLILGIFLVSFTSATITVTLPVPAPTNLTSTLQEGGTFLENTTYYWVVVAYSVDRNGFLGTLYDNYVGPMGYTTNYFSPLSEEANFTTNSTHKSVYFDWDPVNVTTDNGIVYYQIFVSTQSGNYTHSGGYGTTLETVGSIKNTYFTALNPNNGTYLIHSANMINEELYGINKTIGVIKVYIDGGTYGSSGVYGYRYPIQQIYEAVINAGYEDYVYWDGYNFAIKGWIEIDGNSSTNIYIRSASIAFIKGGLIVKNPNANIVFGSWTDDYIGADNLNGLQIILKNGRIPFKCIEGNLSVYGSKFSSGSWGLKAENLSDVYYSVNPYFSYKVDGFKENLIGQGIRDMTTEISDSKFSVVNNWGTKDSFRNRIYSTGALCYSSLCRIYATKFDGILSQGYTSLRFYLPASGASYRTYMYDPIFTRYYDTNNNIPPQIYFMTNYGTLHNDAHLMVFNTIKSEVLDEKGNPIENVALTIKDNNNQTAYWVEHDGTNNKRVTGNNYSSILTDSEGRTNYYVQSYRWGINQSNTIADTYCNNSNFTAYYPYTITFSKEGYKNYTVTLSTLTKETNLIVTLEEQPTWNYSNKITFIIRDLFNYFSSLFKIDEYGNVGIKGVLIENTNVSAYDNAFCFSKDACITKEGNLAIAGNLIEEI